MILFWRALEQNARLIKTIQLYLQSMENFCKYITNPDWWSVIATIIAAIVAAVITYVLGRRQNELQQQQLKIQERQNELQEQQVKLQEQQNEIQKYQTKLQEQQIRQQEYAIYKELYSTIKDIDSLGCAFLMRVGDHFSDASLKELGVNTLKYLDDETSKLSERLSQCALDFELKLNGDIVDFNSYNELLLQMQFLLMHMGNMEQDKIIKYVATNLENVPYYNRPSEIDIICERVDDDDKQTTRHILDNFRLLQEKTLNLNTLNKIKKYIIPVD